MNIGPQDIKVSYGPSLYASYKCVIIDFDRSVFGSDKLLSSAHHARLSAVLPQMIYKKLPISEIDDTNKLLISLIRAFLGIRGQLDLTIELKAGEAGKYQLLVEYYNELTTRFALNASFLVISHLNSPAVEPPPQIVKQIEYLMTYLITHAPGDVFQGMTVAARKRDIPYYSVDNNSFVTMFGQGVHSVMFDRASSEFDSKIGFDLQNDKIRTNLFLRKAGYPTTEQKVAHSFDMCMKIVEQLGYPVVTKPQSSGGGRGVTANINTMDQLEYGYNEAAKYSPNNILVEKHVVGDVYRLTMSMGKFIGGALRYPAQVTGDGKNTIRALIDKENLRRKEPEFRENRIKQIAFDDRLKQNLSSANFNLESIPDEEKTVLLGDIANRSAGGTLSVFEEADMHPDYMEMAIDLGKMFRLDNIGIDVITPDISRSWREIGVIIEMNAYPMAAPAVADRLLNNYFSETDGRIDATLIVSDDPEFSQKIFNEKRSKQENVGFTNRHFAIFKGGKLMAEDEGLYNRCLSLFLNNNCDAIIVEMSPDEIMETGLPNDYFDHCIIDLKSNFNSGTVNSLVEKMTDVDNLEPWLMKYVGHIEKY